MNCYQNSDQFTLAQTLGIMERLGNAAPEYIVGYEHGFENAPFAPPTWDTRSDLYLAYTRGRRVGRDAYWRGAHGEKRES